MGLVTLGSLREENTHFLRGVVQLEPEECSEGVGAIHLECSIFSELVLCQRCMMYSPPARDMKKILEDIMNVKLYDLRILLTFGADRIIVR